MAPPFKVEVTGTWRDPALSPYSDEDCTEVYLVAAPGPGAARVAGVQLFGRAAAGRRRIALPGSESRVLAEID
jgi:hypothetical protein